jgi:predicted flap endonuclease-1-like 5' DNA nuclease
VTKIMEIPGVGPVDADILLAAGIRTSERLLKVAGSGEGRRALSSETGIRESVLLLWVRRADILRLKGVGPEFAGLLEHAGIISVSELGQRRPDNLHARMLEINASRRLVRRTPTLADVQRWVAQAKRLRVAVTGG